MKKWISVLLSITIITAIFPVVSFAKSNTFKDVTGDEYYAVASDALSQLDILAGYPDGTFGAEKSITRAEMAAVIVRMLGMSDEATDAEGKTRFDDVASNHWASGYINVATDEKIIVGDGDGKFRPEDNVKHEEAAKMVVCAVGLGDNVKFDPNDWSKEYLSIAASNGITNDVKSSKGKTSSRGDVAVMVYNGLTKDLAAPTASKKEGSYSGTQKIELSTSTKDAEIYYTTDGSAPTVKSTKYTKAISITKTTTIRAIAVLKGILVSDEFKGEYTFKTSGGGGGGGGGGSSASSTYTVSFDLNYDGATGAPTSQRVKKGELASMPDDPEREGFVFIGWYCEKGYSELYDFDKNVNSDLILYAKWFNENDKTDTDGDGLTDDIEKNFETNINKIDTDDDGLSDYYELDILGYNPLLQDTDRNGISDADEDYDEDGLTNIEDILKGCNPTLSDSDNDLLSDVEEINKYGTNPCSADTDQDGVNDGTEIECGSDPNAKESTFEMQVSVGEVDEGTPVVASAKVNTDSIGAGTLNIQEVTPGENPLISKNIAGYLGSAYDFAVEGSLLDAEVTFEYDSSLGEIGEDFQPRVYYVNEETGMFEELPNQNITDGSVTVEVSHFSTYILLNKVEFDKIWEADIKNPFDQGEDSPYTHMAISFVIDSSGSMSSNDGQGIRKTVAKNFVDKMSNNDTATVIDFDSTAKLLTSNGFTKDKQVINSAIDEINNSGGTDLGAGMELALTQFENYTESNDAYKIIIMLTDGEGDYDESLTQRAKDNGIIVYTIGLGSGINESLLTSIAEETGGKYYYASQAEELEEVFDDVAFETIDYTTDSNNDGISDYYTKLLNDGKMTLDGNYDLIEVSEIYGEESDDWDNDGLKNGEEIKIINNGNDAYAKMGSNPIINDTDGDGYSDYQEFQTGTPRMKYTETGCTYLDELEDDSYYIYVDAANDRGLLSNFNAFFLTNKKDKAKDLYIDYFYDYAPSDSIEKNKEKITAAKSREVYLNYAQSFANILKMSKDICSTADDVSKMVEGSSDSGNSKEFVDKLKDKTIKVKGASAQVRKSRKAIIDAINLNKFEDDKLLQTLLTDTDGALKTYEELGEEIDAYDISEFTFELTGKLQNLTSTIAGSVKTAKTVYEGVKYIKLDFGFKNLSNEYQNFIKAKGTEIPASTWIGVGIDVVSGALDIWENCERYGKMKANRDAYLAYMDLLYHISNNAEDEYDKVAAREIADIIADESWRNYDSQLLTSNSKTVASASFEATFDLAAAANPYIAIANAVYKIIKSTISVTGLSGNARMLLNFRTTKTISDGCKYIIDKNVEKENQYFSYDLKLREYIYSYICQLAQSRIVGVNYVKERVNGFDIAALVSKLFEGGDIDEACEIIIEEIYRKSDELNLDLSSELPYYSNFGKKS